MNARLLIALFLTLTSLTLKSNANSRDVFTVWDEQEITSYKVHTVKPVFQLSENCKKIQFKKFKRYKTRALVPDISFRLKTFDFTSPQFSLERSVWIFLQKTVVAPAVYFSLRGPPALC